MVRCLRRCVPICVSPPLVGAITQARDLWVNFGHGHQGFTLGPTTAELLAEAIDGAPPVLTELAPASRLSANGRSFVH